MQDSPNPSSPADQLPPEAEAILEDLAFFIRGGRSPADAARRLAMQHNAELVDTVLAEYRRRTGVIRLLREPGAIIDSSLESWYLGPQDGDKFWPAFEQHLRGKGRDTDTLDKASSKIVSLLQPPGAGSIRTRGLVLGYVQSGKTENFTAVISKAADVGYRFFIVLSGLNNVLRNQTQRRLDSDIIALNPGEWITVTEPTTDFRVSTNVNAFLTERQSGKIIGVIKKNKGRLNRLLTWLNSAATEVLRNCPVLIIDDEADQASPNTAKAEEDRTQINGLLVNILRTLPKAAYVGYTATPFANFLIDPSTEEDLYPRDFIVELPRPDSYFGPERIFGRDQLDWEEPDEHADGLDMVRVVEDDEVVLLRPPGRDARDAFYPSVTKSLREAFQFYVLAVAARRARGQTAEHSTMLLHTTEYTSVHDRFFSPVQRECDQFRQQWEQADDALQSALVALWEREQATLPPESVGRDPVPFTVLREHIPGVLADLEVKLEHGRSTDRISYPDVEKETPGRIYVVIGGNVLSRGLTLEGLLVSFFLRSASAYDTLLQMGRWFGFRQGYEDLPRLWMTQDLKSYFYHLAIVEREIRYDIDRYKNGHITPLDFGVRIRTHPTLAITSRLKMQKARHASMNFSGEAPQTRVFYHRNQAWLNANRHATARLLTTAAETGGFRQLADRPHLVNRDVPAVAILTFLSEYAIHPTHDEMKTDLLRKYIKGQNDKGRLKTWDVVVITRDGAKWGTIDLTPEVAVPLINRSRHRRNLVDADVKALMSGLDIGSDLDVPNHILEDLTRAELLNLRNAKREDVGLLLIYPINKDSVVLSKKGERTGERMPLEAVDHIIGLGIVFPDTPDASAVEYVTVDLSYAERDEPDEVDLEDED